MKKIPFDISLRSQIEDGTYRVVTRKGLPARIICWDLLCKDFPIAAAYINDETETEDIASFTTRGEFEGRAANESDLFLLDGTITDAEKDYIKCILPPFLKDNVFVNSDGMTIGNTTIPWNLFIEIAELLSYEQIED